MKLYAYFRSSASFRVRIALHLKGLPYTTVPVHLLKEGGAQHQPDFLARNPEALVPVLEVPGADAPHFMSQSLAIIEYLEECDATVPLLPAHPVDRAYVRGLALSVACDIHPLNNLRVLQYLEKTFSLDEAQRNQWYRHWCESGLEKLETRLAGDARTGRFCYGDTPGLADCFLIPQIFNAQRFSCDMSGMPHLMRIYETCMALPAFRAAAPAAQADAE